MAHATGTGASTSASHQREEVAPRAAHSGAIEGHELAHVETAARNIPARPDEDEPVRALFRRGAH
jgi:hypothetical protein